MQQSLAMWSNTVTQMRTHHQCLLFVSVPKLLKLYTLFLQSSTNMSSRSFLIQEADIEGEGDCFLESEEAISSDDESYEEESTEYEEEILCHYMTGDYIRHPIEADSLVKEVMHLVTNNPASRAQLKEHIQVRYSLMHIEITAKQALSILL